MFCVLVGMQSYSPFFIFFPLFFFFLPVALTEQPSWSRLSFPSFLVANSLCFSLVFCGFEAAAQTAERVQLGQGNMKHRNISNVRRIFKRLHSGKTKYEKLVEGRRFLEYSCQPPCYCKKGQKKGENVKNAP